MNGKFHTTQVERSSCFVSEKVSGGLPISILNIRLKSLFFLTHESNIV